MHTDIFKLLYSSRIYCFPERQLYTQKKISYVVTLFWAQKRKLGAKYSTRVCEMKSDFWFVATPEFK